MQAYQKWSEKNHDNSLTFMKHLGVWVYSMMVHPSKIKNKLLQLTFSATEKRLVGLWVLRALFTDYQRLLLWFMTAALKVPPVLLLPGLLLPCSFLFQIPDCQLCDLPSDQALNAVSGLDLSFPQRTGLALPSMPTVKTVHSSSSPRPRSWQGQQTPDLQPCPCGLSGVKCNERRSQEHVMDRRFG